LNGGVAAILGVGPGLGAAVARRFAREGFAVAIMAREEHTMLSPDAIAETYWQLHIQDRTAWTLELDLRPSVESF